MTSGTMFTCACPYIVALEPNADALLVALFLHKCARCCDWSYLTLKPSVSALCLSCCLLDHFSPLHHFVHPSCVLQGLLFLAFFFAVSFPAWMTFPAVHPTPSVELNTLPSVMVDGYFQLQDNSLCLQGTAEASLPKRSTALPVLQNQLFFSPPVARDFNLQEPSVNWKTYSSTSCFLQRVVPTYLCNPWLMTTHETVFSICKEFISISVQYLPYCRVTCTSSA